MNYEDSGKLNPSGLSPVFTEMAQIHVSIDPENLSKEISCLEYPEFIENINDFGNKLKTIDEQQYIYRPIRDGSDRLTVTSNTQTRNLIILKIKKGPDGIVKSADFIGLSRKFHVFRELFDFTAESECENHLLQSFRDASENFNEVKIDSISKSIKYPNINWDTFCIPPYKFSHINLPLSSRDIRQNLKTTQKDDILIQDRSWNVSFNEPDVPSKPADDCITKAKNLPREHIDAVAKIFEERPIVSKLYIKNKINDASIIANLRQILPLLAFHWKNGPWHLLWTKYGTDPRKDPKYRFYQSVELRNKMFAKELRRGKSAPKNQDSIQSSFNEASNYCFDGENMILNYLTYQYADLTYHPLQEIVNYPGGMRETVSDKEGWYPDGTIKKLRDIMKQRWFELLRNMDLSSLPQNKLEEILEITAPSVTGSAIGSDWNSLRKISQMQKCYEESDNENNAIKYDEGSDYEIFDY